MDHSITHIRPRFRFTKNASANDVLNYFSEVLSNAPDHITSKITDSHITVDIVGIESHFWSPHLDFRIEEDEENPHQTIISGLIGPSPSVWTLFMFIYFIIALVGFIVFSHGVSKWMMNEPTYHLWALPITILLMATAYKAGKFGEQLGADQVNELKALLREVINRK